MFEAGEIAHFGEHPYSRGELDAAHCLQPQDGRVEPPVDYRVAQCRLKTLTLRHPVGKSMAMLFEC
ncbi:hypothetical protein VI03_31205 [Burkholderia vietnamiensis]|nr:hypothetical protein VI03_31205 [Burkholderia vietnamiensis]KVR83000.1 hypothetical protein WK24_27040 [Burkholderia vietnamiensis]